MQKHDVAVASPAEDAESDGLRSEYRNVRARSLQLIDGLSAEDCQIQSMEDASPLKWHLAHTTWFFETFVLSELPAYRLFDPSFTVLFNSYYDAVGERYPRSQRGLLTRPDMDTVRAYRAHVDAALCVEIDQIVALGLAPRVTLGLHHEQQHQELMLTDLLHAFSCNLLLPSYSTLPAPRSDAMPMEWLSVSEGIHSIGHDGRDFAFDNESPRHRVWLDAYALAMRPVTNAEYRAFIDDGGYQTASLWLSDGWAALRAGALPRPLYWSADGDSAFGLYGLQALDLHAPVCHLNYYEADAYARWARARLPSEAEWEVAMATHADVLCGSVAQASALRPVLRAGVPACAQVWEWTSSAYGAYPGFRPDDGALGEYNGKFMCNQWVLRGGSFASPPGHLRKTYRNFFPPSASWQFSGLRLARDA